MSFFLPSNIHRRSSEGDCQVVGVNSLGKQFCLEFFCNNIKAPSREKTGSGKMAE